LPIWLHKHVASNFNDGSISAFLVVIINYSIIYLCVNILFFLFIYDTYMEKN
jgi:hypothetical protein